jgi:hypothetical protein
MRTRSGFGRNLRLFLLRLLAGADRPLRDRLADQKERDHQYTDPVVPSVYTHLYHFQRYQDRGQEKSHPDAKQDATPEQGMGHIAYSGRKAEEGRSLRLGTGVFLLVVNA